MGLTCYSQEKRTPHHWYGQFNGTSGFFYAGYVQLESEDSTAWRARTGVAAMANIPSRPGTGIGTGTGTKDTLLGVST